MSQRIRRREPPARLTETAAIAAWPVSSASKKLLVS
jgi:hypothetical protein